MIEANLDYDNKYMPLRNEINDQWTLGTGKYSPFSGLSKPKTGFDYDDYYILNKKISFGTIKNYDLTQNANEQNLEGMKALFPSISEQDFKILIEKSNKNAFNLMNLIKEINIQQYKKDNEEYIKKIQNINNTYNFNKIINNNLKNDENKKSVYRNAKPQRRTYREMIEEEYNLCQMEPNLNYKNINNNSNNNNIIFTNCNNNEIINNESFKDNQNIMQNSSCLLNKNSNQINTSSSVNSIITTGDTTNQINIKNNNSDIINKYNYDIINTDSRNNLNKINNNKINDKNNNKNENIEFNIQNQNNINAIHNNNLSENFTQNDNSNNIIENSNIPLHNDNSIYNDNNNNAINNYIQNTNLNTCNNFNAKTFISGNQINTNKNDNFISNNNMINDNINNIRYTDNISYNNINNNNFNSINQTGIKMNDNENNLNINANFSINQINENTITTSNYNSMLAQELKEHAVDPLYNEDLKAYPTEQEKLIAQNKVNELLNSKTMEEFDQILLSFGLKKGEKMEIKNDLSEFVEKAIKSVESLEEAKKLYTSYEEKSEKLETSKLKELEKIEENNNTIANLNEVYGEQKLRTLRLKEELEEDDEDLPFNKEIYYK